MFKQASCCVRDIVEVNELTMIFVFVNNTLSRFLNTGSSLCLDCVQQEQSLSKTTKTPNLLKNFGGKYHLLYKVQ